MATILEPPTQAAEQHTILYNISWETYERLLAEHTEVLNPRFFYDTGVMEIMVVSSEHERPNRLLASLFEILAGEFEIDFENIGSNTFKRKDLKKGFEPDTCFYIKNVDRMRGKKRLELGVDPPPDLVIEIDITHSSMDKLSIYAAVGVPEVWRYDGENLMIYKLQNGQYETSAESIALPRVTSAKISEFIESSKTLKRPEWLRQVREWAQKGNDE